MTIIGVDPHPNTITAAALNEHGRVLAHKTIKNNPQGHQALRAWASDFPERRWAIEGASNHYALPLTRLLRNEDERVVNVNPNLTSQYRSRRTNRKNDNLDAENAARALLANPDLSELKLIERQLELQELTRTRAQLTRELQAHQGRATNLTSTHNELSALALNTVITALRQAITLLDKELKRLLRDTAPDLLRVQGVGPVLAAVILAETGDVHRFKNEGHFASYCGAAPIERYSGGGGRYCVNPRGDRRLNWVLHLITLTRLRSSESTRAYRDKQLAEGRKAREILRALKTIIARELYHYLKNLDQAGGINWSTPNP